MGRPPETDERTPDSSASWSIAIAAIGLAVLAILLILVLIFVIPFIENVHETT